jgi:predicted nucleotidyltransferase
VQWSLYIDDPAADDVRPTQDIDLTFEILNANQLEELREDLNQRGFKQHPEDDVMCGFRLKDKKVDVMSTKEVGWAPANPWFEAGFANSFDQSLEDMTIRLMPLPYFLATKFEAFKSRGRRDPRMSKDFEDIVYLLNYTSDFPASIQSADEEVKIYLIACLKEIQNDDLLQEAVIAHMYFEEQEERFQMIMDQIKLLVNGV